MFNIWRSVIFDRFVECCEVNVEGKWVKGQRGVCVSLKRSITQLNYNHYHVSPERYVNFINVTLN